MQKETLERMLQREVDEWSGLRPTELELKLREVCAYQRTGSEGEYQVEVVLLEATAEYLHVSVAVDDGGWRAWKPLCRSFLVSRAEK